MPGSRLLSPRRRLPQPGRASTPARPLSHGPRGGRPGGSPSPPPPTPALFVPTRSRPAAAAPSLACRSLSRPCARDPAHTLAHTHTLTLRATPARPPRVPQTEAPRAPRPSRGPARPRPPAAPPTRAGGGGGRGAERARGPDTCEGAAPRPDESHGARGRAHSLARIATRAPPRTRASPPAPKPSS